MSARKQINQSLSSIILFLRLYKTFQIGQLLKICQKLDQQPALYDDKIFARMLAQFIYHVNEQNKKNHTEHEYLAIMIAESLIFNLYQYNNKSGMNNSIYGNSFMISSSSQIGIPAHDLSSQSIKNYESIEQHFSTNFVTFLFDFMTDSQLIKKLKQMIQRSGRKAGQGINLVQKYIDILLQTAQYIFNKQGKLDKNKSLQFQNIKHNIGSKNTTISDHFQKKNLKKIISQVNKIIFSSKLNRIVFLLQQAEEKIYLSLLRIYLAQNCDQFTQKGKKIKYFLGIGYSGEEMLLNLSWAYVQSIPNKNKLFQSSKNPLFRLIQCHLFCLYMSVFRSFHQIVGKCCKFDFNDGAQFYKVCQTTINKDLCQFIQQIPIQLFEYLRLTYRIVLSSEIKSYKKQTGINISKLALIGVKKLLVYSLLGNPHLIETYYSQGVDLDKYQQVCNFIINLFFKTSSKKNQTNSNDAQIMANLTKSISNMLDEKILGYMNVPTQQNVYLDDFQKGEGIKGYAIQQPILNYDYEVLWEIIKNIQFTPKDLKQFQMHKKSDLSEKLDLIHVLPVDNSLNNTSNYLPILNSISPRDVWSPMQRGKKDSVQFNQSIEYIQHGNEQIPSSQKQQIDFLTWMTVGGTRDYQNRNTMNNQRSLKRKNQNKEFITFPKEKIKQISRLYQQFQRIKL